MEKKKIKKSKWINSFVRGPKPRGDNFSDEIKKDQEKKRKKIKNKNQEGGTK